MYGIICVLVSQEYRPRIDYYIPRNIVGCNYLSMQCGPGWFRHTEPHITWSQTTTFTLSTTDLLCIDGSTLDLHMYYITRMGNLLGAFLYFAVVDFTQCYLYSTGRITGMGHVNFFYFIKTYLPRITHQPKAVLHEVLLHTTTITC